MGAENQILQVDTGGPSNAIVKQPHKAKQFSKMSPTPLKKFVEGGVSDDQRRAINSIGFGSFLFLDVDEMPSDLCRWLLRHFDPFKCSINLKNSQLDVTVDDFHLALGLPKSGSNVQEAGRREATLEYNDLVTSWLNHLQRDRNNITISDVIAKMKQQVDGGDDFKRNFVIVVVSTLIKGNQKGLPNYKLLKSLGDVNSITSLNWSQFALESLTDCARDWQESDGTSLFTGPMLPLLLCYMDRVCFMGRLVNRQFPLIRWWKKKDVCERRNFELLKAGEFGTGDVKERIEAHNEGNQANNRSEQEFLRANTDSKKACIQKVAEAAHQLSIAFANFLEAMDDASIKFPKHEAIAKLSNLANSIVEVFEESEVKECTQPSGSPKLDEDDEYFNSPSFLKAIDEMEKTFAKQKPHSNEEQATKQPPLVQKTHSKSDDMPSFDLGIDCSPDNNANVLKKRKNLGSKPSQPSRRSPRLSLTTSNEPVRTPPATTNLPYFSSGDLKIDENVAKTKVLRKRECNPSLFYKSPYFIRNINVLKDLTYLEKSIADWAFGDLDKSEILFQDDCISITRDHLSCLSSEHGISFLIIDLWAHILNVGEKKKDLSSVSRYFFPGPHLFLYDSESSNCDGFKNLVERNISSSNIDLTKIQLLFFPIHEAESPVLICFNFPRGVIQVINVAFKKADFSDEVGILANALSVYFRGKLRRASAIPKFKVEELDLPSPKNSKMDAGIYLMRYMETFKGASKGFDHQLNDATDGFLKRLRVKYCSFILTNDANTLKLEIENKVKKLKGKNV